MPPKRPKKNVNISKTFKAAETTADVTTDDVVHFLNAFAKPSQIYRFLEDRAACSPYFLRRTLYYMRHRRSCKKRKGKKITADTLLAYVLLNKPKSDLKTSDGYLTLTYLGLFNQGNKMIPKEPLEIETILLKMSHQRRKELWRSVVVINPPSENPPPKVPTVSIPAKKIHLNCSKVKPYTILLRVIVNPNEYQMLNNNSINNDIEPKPKRIKLSNDCSHSVEFGMELVVFDKHQRCLIEDGNYEFVLGELENCGKNARISASSLTWEELNEETTKQHIDSFEKMTKGPTLQFQLKWTKEATKPIVVVDRPPQFSPFTETILRNSDNNNVTVPIMKHPERTKTIVYQFGFNNKFSSETETTRDLMNCPWCYQDCKFIYSLLWHLKLCHTKFNFQLTQMSDVMKIDVSINESYDGSYAGCPKKQTSLTHVVVCHPERTKTMSLSEFIEIKENDHEKNRPKSTGHSRVYYHSRTYAPINPNEIDVDSEDEREVPWVKQKVMNMIDEFIDVNEGEKEFMKMWNVYFMKHESVLVGDCQIPKACLMFVKEKGEELLRRNLYRNFLLFLSMLNDYGLISPVAIVNISQMLQAIMRNDSSLTKQLRESWQPQKQPQPDLSVSEKSPGISGASSVEGLFRKPSSIKKPKPKKNIASIGKVDRKEEINTKRKLSLPPNPELRKQFGETSSSSAASSSVANSSALRLRSVTAELKLVKNKPDRPV